MLYPTEFVFKPWSLDLRKNCDMKKPSYLSLQHSESVIAAAAANIFAAYITSNHVKEGEEEAWMLRAVDEAIWIAMKADEKVHSDNEMG